MPYLKRRTKFARPGFTLLELVVVIVILGILAAFAAPRFLGFTDDAKFTKATSDIEALSTALNLYRLDMGVYPTMDQGLEALVVQPEGNTGRWRKGGYLEKRRVPLDPWKNNYVYLFPGSNNDFDIICYGADGEPGGEDLNRDVNSWEIE